MAYTGTVKSFNPQKGWGFIECRETFHLAGKDIFVLKSSLPTGTATPGDTVRFDVAQGQKGPEATNVTMLLPVALAALSGGIGATSAISAPAAHRSSAIGTYPGAAAASGGSHQGFVKSFNAQKGWGFISSPALQQSYGKDVFFMKSSILGGAMVGPGTEVNFTVTQGQKGPEGRDIQAIGLSAYGPMATKASLQAAQPLSIPGIPPALASVIAANPTLRALLGQAQPAGAVAASGAAKSISGQTFVGTIKGWNEEKGWGHISCDAATAAYGKDIFFMKSVLNGEQPEIGTTVSVKVTMAAKGPQAESIRLLPNNALGSHVFSGEVKSYNESNGWGFVSGPEVLETFGKDIFLHKQELGGRVPSIGDVVNFTVEVSNKGQFQAKNVEIHDDSGSGRTMQPPPPLRARRMSPY